MAEWLDPVGLALDLIGTALIGLDVLGRPRVIQVEKWVRRFLSKYWNPRRAFGLFSRQISPPEADQKSLIQTLARILCVSIATAAVFAWLVANALEAFPLVIWFSYFAYFLEPLSPKMRLVAALAVLLSPFALMVLSNLSRVMAKKSTALATGLDVATVVLGLILYPVVVSFAIAYGLLYGAAFVLAVLLLLALVPLKVGFFLKSRFGWQRALAVSGLIFVFCGFVFQFLASL